MSLITPDELVRGVLVVAFGSAAGAAALSYPGSALWVLPAVLGMAGASMTIPEVRQEARKALPGVQAGLQGLLPAAPTNRTPPRKKPVQDPPAERHPLFVALEDEPHRLIIGHTEGGKTTLIHTMAMHWAADGQRVIVFDPDSAPGQWPRCTVAGHGDNYEAISQGLVIVAREVSRRRSARAEGVRQFRPVHIVIDEVQDVIGEVPEAMPVIESLARRGRKIGMHLTLGVQDKQVKTLGLEGKGDLRKNFQVAEMTRHEGGRVALVHRSDGTIAVPVPDMPDPESFIRTRRPPVQTADDLLASLLTGSLPGTSSSASPRPGTGTGTGSGIQHGTSTSTGSEGGSSASEQARTSIEENGRVIRVDVRASAEVTRPSSYGRRRSGRKGASVDVARRSQAAKEYQAVKALVAQKKSANVIQKALGLGRPKTQELVRRAKEELSQ